MGAGFEWERACPRTGIPLTPAPPRRPPVLRLTRTGPGSQPPITDGRRSSAHQAALGKRWPHPSLHKKPKVFLLTRCGSFMPLHRGTPGRGLALCLCRGRRLPQGGTGPCVGASPAREHWQVRRVRSAGREAERPCPRMWHRRSSAPSAPGKAGLRSGIRDPHRVSQETVAPGEMREPRMGAGQPQSGARLPGGDG